MQTRNHQGSRRWLVLTVGGVLAALLVAVYAYAYAERRRPVEIYGATEIDAVVLQFYVGSCGGEPIVTELDQSEDEVRIAFEATTGGWYGNDCLDSIDVRLDAPLSGRVLTDGSNGDEAEVQD